ncbi:MAG: GNAT family N-acetyltransferase [Archaeoglobus sp.]|nr:GNAT family N-acetyltransferase [Archaeoglobus sp.]
MDVELKVVRGTDVEEWDRLVDQVSSGTIFHKWEWLKIAEKYTNCKLYPIVVYKKSTPIGLIPLFYQKKGPLRLVFSPPPHTAILYLGPLLVEYDTLKPSRMESNFIGFIDEVNNFITEKLRAGYVYISMPPGLYDTRPFKWNDYQIEPVYSYIFDLTKGIDFIWKRFDKKVRQDINRTLKRGVTIERGDREELGYIYDLLAGRYAEQGKLLTLPKKYLYSIFDSFADNLGIFVAKYNGEIITGLIDIYYKNKACSWIGNIKPNVKKITPNDLLNWEVIKYAHDHGLSFYEIMGAAGVKRLYAFHSKYNPELLLRFSARKYSSFIFRLMEARYSQTLKPIYAKFKLGVKGV